MVRQSIINKPRQRYENGMQLLITLLLTSPICRGAGVSHRRKSMPDFGPRHRPLPIRRPRRPTGRRHRPEIAAWRERSSHYHYCCSFSLTVIRTTISIVARVLSTVGRSTTPSTDTRTHHQVTGRGRSRYSDHNSTLLDHSYRNSFVIALLKNTGA